jgi:phosphoglycerate dehydrogenase-like enzyme
MTMRALIMDRGTHADPAAIRKECPSIQFDYAPDEQAALQCCGEAEVLLAMAHEVSDELVSRMPKLRYVCAMSAGTDRLETLTTLKPDVLITSARGIHGPQMSELAFLSMIALSRDFKRMQRNQQQHAWERWPQRLIFGKTAVIVGIGPIAEELAARCVAFGMRVIGVSDARDSAPGFERMMKRSELPQAAALADFMILLVPHSASTTHLIEARVLGAMKRGGILINLARGPVVDEKALVRALQSGLLGGAGLDVFEEEPLPDASPLWDMPNVIITPRIGGMSDVYPSQMLPLLLHNLRCYEQGRLDDLKNVVRRRSVLPSPLP